MHGGRSSENVLSGSSNRLPETAEVARVSSIRFFGMKVTFSIKRRIAYKEATPKPCWLRGLLGRLCKYFLARLEQVERGDKEQYSEHLPCCKRITKDNYSYQ